MKDIFKMIDSILEVAKRMIYSNEFKGIAAAVIVVLIIIFILDETDQWKGGESNGSCRTSFKGIIL